MGYKVVRRIDRKLVGNPYAFSELYKKEYHDAKDEMNLYLLKEIGHTNVKVHEQEYYTGLGDYEIRLNAITDDSYESMTEEELDILYQEARARGNVEPDYPSEMINGLLDEILRLRSSRR
jgi:hypothetical protein